MKKLFSVLFLILFILITFSIVILEILSQGSEDNFFNSKYRKYVTQFPILRTALNLHDDGDARKDYLGNNYSRITLEVDEMTGSTIPVEALDLLTQKIHAITGKPTTYIISDTNIPRQDVVTRADIDKLASQYRNFSNTNDTAFIYLIYLSSYDLSVTQIGTTYKDSGLVLFDGALKDYSKRHPENFGENIESTALHEFGHQLGLPHNDIPGCLMQAVSDDFDYNGNENGVITDFCDYEKQLISKS